MKFCKFPYAPMVLNTAFNVATLAYVQANLYQPYIMGTNLILLCMAITICVCVKRQLCPNFIMIDYSPFIFEILHLTNMLATFREDSTFFLTFGFLTGQISSLQHIKDEPQSKYKYWIIKTILQQCALVLITILMDEQKAFRTLVFLIILIIIVGILEIQGAFSKLACVSNLTSSNTLTKQDSQTPSLIQAAEKHLDNWMATLVFKNKQVKADQLSNSLQSYLAESNIEFERLLDRIELVQIQLEMENIIKQNVAQTSQKLSKYIQQQFENEYLERDTKIATKQRSKSIKETPQFAVSPNDSRRRITLTQRQEFELKRGQTIQLNQCSMQYFGDKVDSNSIVSLIQLMHDQKTLNQQAKKPSQFGVLYGEDGVNTYVKITVHFSINNNDCSCFLIIENNHQPFTQYLEFIQVALRAEVTQKVIKEQARKIEHIKNGLLKMVKSLQVQQMEITYLQQVLAQIYWLSHSNQNAVDFLADETMFLQQFSEQEFKIDQLLLQAIERIKYHPIFTHKKLEFKLNNQLKNPVFYSNANKVRQLLLNFILNSISQYSMNDNVFEMNILFTLKDAKEDSISCEIQDQAGGIAGSYDYQRIREGQLGLFVNLKLLPFLSKQATIECQNNSYRGQRGCVFRFDLTRRIKEKHYANSQKLAQLVCF